MATMYYEQDAPLDALKGKKVCVIGYGSQGHAHSQNLRDSGIEVAVAELDGTDNFKLATEHGFSPCAIPEAMDGAALIIITLPDEVQATVYESAIHPNLKAGQTLGFCHGFNIHFGYIVPPADTNIVMIAPKGPGHLVRSEYEKGGGVPCLIAVQQAADGNAKNIALAWANIAASDASSRAAICRRSRNCPSSARLSGAAAIDAGRSTAK